MSIPDLVIALHYQNENCHRDGAIKVGVGPGEETWRAEMLAAAKRLFAGARAHGVPIVHVRLAVRPDYADVVPCTPLFRDWIEKNAWREGTWGVDFIDGLGPTEDELVVTHIRNDPFIGTALAELIAMKRPERLVCAGVSTAYVVESTVRHATDLGYPCVVAADACSTATRERHDAALRAMALLGEISDVDTLVTGFATR